MNEYLGLRKLKSEIEFPRLPLECDYDLTYRCNNNCRHCWLRIPPGAKERYDELKFDEIKRIVDEARQMGCRSWHFTGGEPMIRPDFPEIFDYITRKAVSYTINTNGTLITPEIAKLLKKKGTKLISIYGATEEVFDHITRNPGSFEATFRGVNYLKEAGADFTLQILPMKDNYHQFDDMINIAKSFGVDWRLGAEWYYLSTSGNSSTNQDIINQRLTPEQAFKVTKPELTDFSGDEVFREYTRKQGDDRVFVTCIESRRRFSLDPYGNMSFCFFVKEPEFLYNLRKGSLREGWDEFLPSLIDKFRLDKEYFDNCEPCEMKDDCVWCPGASYLENRNYSRKIKYLCEIAKIRKEFRENQIRFKRSYYQVAGITFQLDFDLPVTETTFSSSFKKFQKDKPGDDIIEIHHHFDLPDLSLLKRAEIVHQQLPWAIYNLDGSWIYLSSFSDLGKEDLSQRKGEIKQIGVFKNDYTRAKIYNPNSNKFIEGNLQTLSLYTGDHTLLSQILANRSGFALNAGSVIFNGVGLVFVNHEDDILKELEGQGEIFSKEKTIIRKWPEGYRIHGIWEQNSTITSSVDSVPLDCIMFIEKSQDNRIVLINDRKEIEKRLYEYLVKPIFIGNWWNKIHPVIDDIVENIPAYVLESGASDSILEKLRNSVLTKSN